MPVMRLNDSRIAHDVTGSGPPLLLLHGFPQTRALWRHVIPALAEDYTVVTADLRGYGGSQAARDAGPAAHGFRAMARDQVGLMRELGFEGFHLAGHDRGGRVAHRLALDHPEAVRSLTVMDIVPTHRLLSDWTAELAAAYWHWTFLAQPAPFPESLIGHDPDRFFEACLLGWGGSSLENFDPLALAEYRTAWRRPEVIAGMCADYRATLTVDHTDDAADLARRVGCPALVLYGAESVMGRMFDVAATWADRLERMEAEAIPGGHFFVDQHPEKTGAALRRFLSRVN